jgi:hypothetical protein
MESQCRKAKTFMISTAFLAASVDVLSTLLNDKSQVLYTFSLWLATPCPGNLIISLP